MSRSILSSLLMFILSITVCCRVYAHPHNWIDLKTEFVFDNDGYLIGVKQDWTFDVYYSTIKLADIASEYDNQQAGFNQLAVDIAKNLGNYGYFSDLKIGNDAIDLPEPNESTLRSIFEKGQQQLVLTMSFSLKAPMKKERLSWRVFDPTYYIAMRHHKVSQVVINKEHDKDCSINLDVPEPSDELIEYATSLDRTQKDTQGLGAHFAETVFIRCL